MARARFSPTPGRVHRASSPAVFRSTCAASSRELSARTAAASPSGGRRGAASCQASTANSAAAAAAAARKPSSRLSRYLPTIVLYPPQKRKPSAPGAESFLQEFYPFAGVCRALPPAVPHQLIEILGRGPLVGAAEGGLAGRQPHLGGGVKGGGALAGQAHQFHHGDAAGQHRHILGREHSGGAHRTEGRPHTD